MSVIEHSVLRGLDGSVPYNALIPRFCRPAPSVIETRLTVALPVPSDAVVLSHIIVPHLPIEVVELERYVLVLF